MSPRGLRRLGPQPCPWHQGRSNGCADADAELAFGPIDQIDTRLKGRTRAGKAAVREHGTAAKPPGPPAAITGAGARNSVGPQGWSGACGSGRTARIPETALLSPCPATGMRPPGCPVEDRQAQPDRRGRPHLHRQPGCRICPGDHAFISLPPLP